MSIAKDIAGTAVGIGSMSLVARASKLKNATPKKLTKGFVDLTIGTSLLHSTSKIVNDFN